MKKLLTVLMILLSMNLFANDFGVKVGLNYSLFDDGDTNKDNSFDDSFGGFTVGGFYKFSITNLLSLKTEILLSKDLYPTIFCHEPSNTFNTYNLKIPFLLNLSSKYVDIYGGVYYSRIIFETESEGDYVASDWFDKNDMGLTVGLSFNINNNFFIDARVYLGTNIYKNSFPIYNRSTELSVGYNF
ncbi:porin family protein [bacterium]|nr:porin family protein [bacterium]